ncbi:MAG: DnaD domain protein [Lachnospiraceae bacterium]|nr:DnaD domain protein [Lachnospiraceae bacterium]
MKLHIPAAGGFTVVENTFIDQYMSSANGEFVKVYLYLLRCGATGRDISVSSIADFFDHTEKDVMRALTYWQKQGLLQMSTDADGLPAELTLISPNASKSGSISNSTVSAVPQAAVKAPVTEDKTVDANPSSPVVSVETDSLASHAASITQPLSTGSVKPDAQPVPDVSNTFRSVSDLQPKPASPAKEIPNRHSISPAQKKQLMEEESIQELLAVYQTFLQRPASAKECGNIMYFAHELGFSFELIDHLIEFCVAQKQISSANFMEHVARDWYQHNISTVAQAQEYENSRGRLYYRIFKALGMNNHSPIDAEIEFMDRWLHTWDMPMELIELACERTLLAIQKPSLSYANDILKRWHEGQVKTKEDVTRLDAAYAAEQAKAKAAADNTKAAAGRNTTAPRKPSGQQIAAHEHNWDELTQQLMLAQEGR